MRAIHFAKPHSGSPYLEPLCGTWGSMDTHWTEDFAGVTCGACLDRLGDAGRPREAAGPAGPLALPG